MQTALVEHQFPGKLIIFDGMQRAGKSTLVWRLIDDLRTAGKTAVHTEWNSYTPLQTLINEKKWSQTFTPLTWFGLHFADFVIRYEEIILPALQRGDWVVADRYVYTALSRDVLKGLAADYVFNCYRFAVRPDAVFFTLVTPETALQRQRLLGPEMHPYNSGRDILGAGDDEEIYRQYQALVRRSYLTMAPAHEATIVNGEMPPDVCYEAVVKRVSTLSR